MRLRTDHVAGAVAIAAGLIVWAISGDLPTGRLSMPGAGMMPKLLCALMILFGLMLIIRAGDSVLFSTLDWSDAGHAARVIGITALAVALYTTLGFIVTMTLLLFTLIALEGRNLVAAAVYSLGLSAGTYLLFTAVLRSPLEQGLLRF
jgi:hypothetical protein